MSLTLEVHCIYEAWALSRIGDTEVAAIIDRIQGIHNLMAWAEKLLNKKRRTAAEKRIVAAATAKRLDDE